MDIYINKETGAPVMVENGGVYALAGLGNILNPNFVSIPTSTEQKGSGFNNFINSVTGIFQKKDGTPTTFGNLFNKAASNVSFSNGRVSFTNNNGQQQFMTQGQFNQQFQQGGFQNFNQGGIPGRSLGFNPLWILGGVVVIGGIIWAVK
ncbi:MAG: hypothetical protein ACFB2Y_09845 [Fulvivirga sp.]